MLSAALQRTATCGLKMNRNSCRVGLKSNKIPAPYFRQQHFQSRFFAGSIPPPDPSSKKYPVVPAGVGTVAPMEVYNPHANCYTALDPLNPGQACSDMGGGNEGIPREYIAAFIQQQTKREPEFLGVSTYSGLIWAVLAGWYFIYGYFNITSNYHDTFWPRVFLFGLFD
ncbi:unnamed protein product [Amoebophrya sp. A120]|nr:unnamed protein product [Amoebophrya sp. A120]|eukprot:GSA120T00004716001.1